MWTDMFTEESIDKTDPGVWQRTLIVGDGPEKTKARVTFHKATEVGPLVLVIGTRECSATIDRLNRLQGRLKNGCLVVADCDTDPAYVIGSKPFANLVEDADEVVIAGANRKIDWGGFKYPPFYRIVTTTDLLDVTVRALRSLGLADADTGDILKGSKRRRQVDRGTSAA